MTCTAAATGTGTILTVTMATGKSLTADALATITCTDNLANLATAAAVTFAVESEADTDAATGLTGYTVNNGKATWTSAVRSNLVQNSTAGNLTLTFSTQNSI